MMTNVCLQCEHCRKLERPMKQRNVTAIGVCFKYFVNNGMMTLLPITENSAICSLYKAEKTARIHEQLEGQTDIFDFLEER